MFNFVEPATLAFAFLAANGIDRFLESGRLADGTRPRRPAIAFGCAALLVAWSVYRLATWPHPAVRWTSVLQTGILLLLFAGALYTIRQGHAWVAILLCAAVFIDYKVSGTSRPFSTVPGDAEPFYPRRMMAGVDPHVYDILRDNRQYRLLVDGMQPTDLRRYGLSSPQGFDPLLSKQYKGLIEQYKPFRTNRLLDIRPDDRELLELLGVRYVLTRGTRPPGPDSDFRLVGPRDTVYRVFEYAHSSPAWRWTGSGTASPLRWEDAVREFTVRAGAPGGRLVLIEQHYPGWRAAIDGRPVRIERWKYAFQSIPVPSGVHTARFEYRPVSIIAGAAISGTSSLLFAFWLWSGLRRERARVTQPPAPTGAAVTLE